MVGEMSGGGDTKNRIILHTVAVPDTGGDNGINIMKSIINTVVTHTKYMTESSPYIS